MMRRDRVLILGAAGRDFHNFNVFFKDNEDYEVVGFTAAQIPNIEGRRYPAELAGVRYPDGLPIFREDDLAAIIAAQKVDEVVLSYSDLSYVTVMNLASRALAAGAAFRILSPDDTLLPSSRPVIAVCAVRTGCGKSQTSRYVGKVLKSAGVKMVAIRHPMPYGDLTRQAVQRFADYDDLSVQHCTIEEREEYEAHVVAGNVVYAGVDYGRILKQAEQEADVIVWDGGNNDLPFVRPDLWITVVDPLRPGHEVTYFPGEVNFRRADVILINKANSADPAVVEQMVRRARAVNPGATVLIGASTVTVADGRRLAGKRVLLVEDGPTLTHGEMPYGAGKVAAEKYGAAEIVDPRPFAVGSIAACYEKFPRLGNVVPAMGYYPQQITELEQTINAADCDAVLIGTPIDLGRLIRINKPALRVTYELEDMGETSLADVVRDFLERTTLTGDNGPCDTC